MAVESLQSYRHVACDEDGVWDVASNDSSDETDSSISDGESIHREPSNVASYAPEIVAARLAKAQWVGLKRRCGLIAPTLLLALTLLIVGFWHLNTKHICEAPVSTYVTASLYLVYFVFITSLLPTDTYAVRGACIVAIGFCVLFLYIISVMTAQLLDVQDCSENAEAECRFDIVHGLLLACMDAYLWTFIIRLVGATISLKTRSLLRKIWILFAEMGAVSGAVSLAIGFLDIWEQAVTGRVRRSAEYPQCGSGPRWHYFILNGVMRLFTGVWLLLSPDLPSRFQAYVGSFGSRDVSAAAGIASVIGSCDAKVVMTKAAARCRAVSLDLVTKRDFSSNTPVQDGLNLNHYTQVTRIGFVDAFISHSWHDDADAKWDALQAWRHRFKSEHGREPICWIDKYSIDQNDISDDLLCLPVFLAGSRELVILFGETYLNRLWCVMEVLIFLHMRGESAQEAAVMCPATKNHENASVLAARINRFSVRNAACTKPEDLEMLLAIVEAGFGGFARFDQMVVSLLKRLR
eukprot:TRINITY_DN32312_c0_g1_i1.p1 TRINITY_DN32312_c0_g1~~TRINITY_DN32312_c0_g1_i1.p1  ORF type:complete len:521 (-),score=50.92 TRINITY_DN32312_c0_g1_i1:116-1678(-)